MCQDSSKYSLPSTLHVLNHLILKTNKQSNPLRYTLLFSILQMRKLGLKGPGKVPQPVMAEHG